MKVADTDSFMMVSSQCPDTGIQKSLLVSKQTSTESGYNIFNETAKNWIPASRAGMTWWYVFK
ncbi:hypothetical protein [Wolbachia endosymbiont of Oedothorax gibbosus]|uniref:hypothetical protein n=1 Tax=Wolbachia endosymbiont of Oedothorax gibbosus TaxID=931100 RepID=UPI002023CE08|nr:hypothetical protein [Wolbachia endosymbiont of Oedothorax gibbosus]